MAFLPSVNLRRTFLIARRDYLGYVKTVGFWVSFLLPFLDALKRAGHRDRKYFEA